MTKIKPLQGWRYNPDKIPDFKKVIAPPYDVIGPEQQKELFQSSPYNVVRMDLPQEEDGLGKYEVAQRYFESWKKEKVLIQDPQLSLYVYFQSFALPNGEKLTRKGFFARRHLEEFEEGGVKPHEKTFAGPKEDRLKLTQATQANLSPIFGLYSDPKNDSGPILEAITQGEPLLDIRTEDGSEHRMWKVQDPKKIGGPFKSHPRTSHLDRRWSPPL